jgi:hypothetical protein
VLRRTWILFRARLAMTRRGGWAIPGLVFHAVLGTLLASLVRDVLPAFPYALLALSTCAAFLALSLLSDLGTILRRDEAREWSATLPASDREHNLARTAMLLVSLGALALALVVPFALLAPAGARAASRLALPGAALGLALCIAAVLSWIQWIAWTRLGGLLVLLQTLLLVAVTVGLLRTLGHLPEWARLGPDDPALRIVPPAWFAAALVEPSAKSAVALLGLVLAAGVALALLPPLPMLAARRSRSLLESGLRPIRALAARSWVRADERGAFHLVLDALPREREFALRTLPLFGIPLAFLWAGSSGAESGARADLLALLFFTIGVYLPVLLLNVPVSESPGAAFLMRTAPVPRGAIDVGAVKALFVRYVLPLHVGLAVLALAFSAGDLLVRLWPASLACSLVVLETAYPRCLKLQLPLSVSPEELPGNQDWIGQTAGLALILPLAAVVLNRWASPLVGLGLAAMLFAASLLLERGLRRGPR